jgi:hypothetical protein
MILIRRHNATQNEKVISGIFVNTGFMKIIKNAQLR